MHEALAIAPRSAEAHTARGILHAAHQDGPAALAEFDRALATQPQHADAHNWHSWVSLLTGDRVGGRDHAVQAVELDPRAAESHAHLALALAAAGSAESALDAARRARRLSPYTTADLYEALCLVELRRFDEAQRILQPLAVVRPGELGVAWAGHGPDALLVQALVAQGEVDRARTVAATVERDADPFAAGLVDLALGDHAGAARAFAAVERLTAWPALLVHHHLRETWADVPALHRQLRAAAARDWSMPPAGPSRPPGRKRDESAW